MPRCNTCVRTFGAEIALSATCYTVQASLLGGTRKVYLCDEHATELFKANPQADLVFLEVERDEETY